jgi:hypothetical protein
MIPTIRVGNKLPLPLLISLAFDGQQATSLSRLNAVETYTREHLRLLKMINFGAKLNVSSDPIFVNQILAL